MPNKCGIVNCRGNYDLLSKCRVFKLPIFDPERQKWLAVIPPRKDFDIANAKSFFVCEKHWPQNPPMKKLPGGTTRHLLHPQFLMYLLHACRPPKSLLLKSNLSV